MIEVRVIQKELDIKNNYVYENEDNLYLPRKTIIKNKIIRDNFKKILVPNKVIDFLNNDIFQYNKYQYGISMEIFHIYKLLINYIKFYYFYKNEYIICNKQLAELFNLEIGDSILFLKFYNRLNKLFSTLKNTNTE